MNEPTLLFVYNADGGALSALIDAAHKLISPATYECALCAVTYGAVGMKSEWREYVRALPVPTKFLHRDELRRAWPEEQVPLPAIFLARSDALEPLVKAGEMRLAQPVSELINLLDGRLEAALRT